MPGLTGLTTGDVRRIAREEIKLYMDEMREAQEAQEALDAAYAQDQAEAEQGE